MNTKGMNNALQFFVIGIGAVMTAPFGDMVARPRYKITLPPSNALHAVAHDFSMVAGDFSKATHTIKSGKQLELKLNS